MDPRQLFFDERLKGVCVYCGAQPYTVDHVPSIVFLDDPLPSDLPVVDACAVCNQGFSLDEEYLACLIECVLSGTVDTGSIQREKIKRALVRKPRLARRLNTSKKTDGDGKLIWEPENERVRNVVLKLAQGHAAYELGLPHLGNPDKAVFLPLLAMSESQRTAFENRTSGELQGWPEIGSRAFIRACHEFSTGRQADNWIEVQQGRYRYSVDQGGGASVQIVISEYLACFVEWE